MGHHDHRRGESTLQSSQLRPDGFAQAGVEVTDWLVEQIGVRFLHNRAADCASLLLAAADLLDPPVEQPLDPEQPRTSATRCADSLRRT
jgi:hypothetical protein